MTERESPLARKDDCIEVAFLYDDPLDTDSVDECIGFLERKGGGPSADKEYSVTHWDDPQEPESESADQGRIAELIAMRPTSILRISFDEFHLTVGRNAELQIDATDHLIISADKTPFKSSCPVPGTEIEHRRETFASVLAGITEITDPHGGFGGPGPYPLGDPSNPRTVVDGIVSEMFEIVYLREWAVEEIGRQTVLDLPAWDVQELSTGGVLLLAVPLPDSCSMHVDTCRSIAAELELQPVY